LGFALLSCLAARAHAQTSSDLEAAEAIMDASEPEAKPEPPASPHVFELRWTTMVTASGGEPETSLTLRDDGFRTEELLRPREHKLYPSTAVAAYGEIAALDWLMFRALFDTREIRDGATLDPPVDGVAMNGNPADDELASGATLRELSAILGNEQLSLELGRFQSEVGEGLVYRDYGTGLRVRADFEAMNVGPVEAEILLTSVGQRVDEIEANQLVALRADWKLSPFEHISAFIAGSDDENGEISEVLRSAYAENLLMDQDALIALFLQDQGSGRQGYIGVSAHVIADEGLTMKGRVVLSGGKLRLLVPAEEVITPEDFLEGEIIEIDVGGVAADFEAHYGADSWVDLAAYAFLLSGDAPPERAGTRYRSFIGLAPQWTWTGLFFSGGLNAGLYPNRASAAGINGRGVFGFGPGIELTGDDLSAESRMIVLTSTADPPPPPLGGSSRLYGVELNFLVEWQPFRFMSLGAEVDLLMPGTFFASSELAYLALTRVTVMHAN
jgi:hypothetical protein